MTRDSSIYLKKLIQEVICLEEAILGGKININLRPMAIDGKGGWREAESL